MAELTPMMKQYFEIKEKCRDYILFYRLGDFYEMFFEDAVLASRELELTLTGRDCGQEERAPMCGVPFHAYENYVGRLVRKGYKVAICEQVEDPKSAKGIVKREIVRMITPGTVIEASMLDESQNNFLSCILIDAEKSAVCFADISTGEVYATETASMSELFSEIGRFMPKELLLGCDAFTAEKLLTFIRERIEGIFSPLAEEAFAEAAGAERIRNCFHLCDFTAAGLSEKPIVVRCIGGLLSYLSETQNSCLGNLNTLNVYSQNEYMELDLTARRNLELCETMRSKEKRGSLLWVIDHTQTAMGSRMIRQWLEKPLRNPIHIKKRQTAVGALIDNISVQTALHEELNKIFDIERLIGRVVYGTANCRDLRALGDTLGHLPKIKQLTVQVHAPLMSELNKRIDLLQNISLLIDAAIVDEPPLTIRDGGFIRTGYSGEVDSLRDLASGGKGKIAEIEQQEREKTGIAKLKIGYNRVFGYYIEVSKVNQDSVPAHYIRKQTLANCERYITEELKQLEGTVLSAQERLVALEYELFCEVREQIAGEVHRIQRTAQALSNLDVLCSFAEVAEDQHFICPEVDFSDRIEIREGRHPVVEKVLSSGFFIPNDTLLDKGENRVAIITGPNMAGKSTYMRQVALIAILAQMGSYVPASYAHIGVVDRVFTRVGASDDLASGQSTFMVEMNEVAEILNAATKDSLLIFDEIGRGTSTYDGLSIARAVVEYTTDRKKLGARTLFATHYHELTALENLHAGIKNYNIAVKKRGDDITFLRKIVRGGADDSYGIEVAKLAGVPNPVIHRAKEILRDLEENVSHPEMRGESASVVADNPQMSISDMSALQIADKLRALQIDVMTPIEALNALYELKKLLS